MPLTWVKRSTVSENWGICGILRRQRAGYSGHTGWSEPIREGSSLVPGFFFNVDSPRLFFFVFLVVDRYVVVGGEAVTEVEVGGPVGSRRLGWAPP